MDLTKEEALKLHREMWRDMQKELGDNPSEPKRFSFKDDWVKKHGYVNEWGMPDILDNCFLCEYANEQYLKSVEWKPVCHFCPIDWSSLTPNKDSIYYGTCIEIWQTEDIDKILLLPEKKN